MSGRDVSHDDPRIPSRPLLGMIILTLPVLGIGVVFLAYIVMWSLGLSGRDASGDPVELVFDGCPEALELVEARLADMGLEATSDARPGGFALRAVLTGDPAVDAALPETLASPARLEVRGGDQLLVTNADLVEATVRLDLFMAPYLLLRLHDAAAERVRDYVRGDPRGKMLAWVDGEEVGYQTNANPVAMGELEIDPGLVGNQARMRRVAAWSVTLDHGPLPCAIRPRVAQ